MVRVYAPPILEGGGWGDGLVRAKPQCDPATNPAPLPQGEGEKFIPPVLSCLSHP